MWEVRTHDKYSNYIRNLEMILTTSSYMRFGYVLNDKWMKLHFQSFTFSFSFDSKWQLQWSQMWLKYIFDWLEIWLHFHDISFLQFIPLLSIKPAMKTVISNVWIAITMWMWMYRWSKILNVYRTVEDLIFVQKEWIFQIETSPFKVNMRTDSDVDRNDNGKKKSSNFFFMSNWKEQNSVHIK